VLPALGEVEVRHTTVEQLTDTVPLRGKDSALLGVLKGDARMAAVLARAVWSYVGEPTEALVVPRGSRRWRVPAHEVREIVDELRTRGVRYGAARAMLAHRLAHAVLLQMEAAGDSPDDVVQDAVARSRPVRAYADALWPRLDPAKVVLGLLSDPDLLSRGAAGVLTDAEVAALSTPSLGHVVLDEAQDLSPMQLRAVGRRCSTGSMTVLGDIAQGTTPWSTRSWAESLEHLGQGGAHVEELTRGFRVPSAVIDFAARLLPLIADGLAPPESVREDPGRLTLTPSTTAGLVADVVSAVRSLLADDGSVGLIAPDADVSTLSFALTGAGLAHLRLGRDDEAVGDHEDGEHRLHLVPATVAKGLEFDRVVVVEPAAIAAAEPDERTGLRRLYVVLTRAVTELTVVHAHPLPTPLA
jgi:DNA helicase IV